MNQAKGWSCRGIDAGENVHEVRGGQQPDEVLRSIFRPIPRNPSGLSGSSVYPKNQVLDRAELELQEVVDGFIPTNRFQ